MSSSSSSQRNSLDVSYILDPTYKPPSSSPTNQALYCDANGELHDPDYKPFPLIPSSTRKKRLSINRGSNPRRHYWDLVEEEINSTGEDGLLGVEGDVASHRNRRFSSCPSYIENESESCTKSSIVRSNTGGLDISLLSTSVNSKSTSYDSNPSLFSETSFPSSVNSDTTTIFSASPKSQLSAFEGKCGRLVSSLKDKRRRFSISKSDKPESRRSSMDNETSCTTTQPPLSSIPCSSNAVVVGDDDDEVGRDDEEEEEEEEEIERDTEIWILTPSEKLKREWLALVMRFQFAVFKAERRLKKRVSR